MSELDDFVARLRQCSRDVLAAGMTRYSDALDVLAEDIAAAIKRERDTVRGALAAAIWALTDGVGPFCLVGWDSDRPRCKNCSLQKPCRAATLCRAALENGVAS